MSTFQFPPSIKSRPVYGKLALRSGGAHLLMADGAGAEAVLDLAEQNAGFMKTAHIIFIPRQTSEQSADPVSGASYVERLQALNPAQFHIAPSYEAALPRLRRVLQDARMGIQVYLAGTEGLMGQAQNEALLAGIPMDAIQCEHRGSVARRVQCVHCKGITEDVLTDPYQCSHCGLHLFVRDHYSRRLAAFQGVCIDAEDPGNIPAPQELYT